MNNVVKNFPPPPAPAQAAPAAPATPKREPNSARPTRRYRPSPLNPSRRSFPRRSPPRSRSRTARGAGRHAPGLGREGDHRGYPGACPVAQPQVDTKKLGDDYKVEEGTPSPGLPPGGR